MISKRSILVSVCLVFVLVFGIFLYKNRAYATDEIVDLETSISGQINGTLLSGTGTGTFNLTEGNSSSEIIFTSFPTDTVNPCSFRSWTCKHHEMEACSIRDLSKYFVETTMVFSGVASGTIYTNGTVVKTENGTKSEAETTWSGTYSGPTSSNGSDAVFYETYTPTANPKQLSIIGYRVRTIQGQGIIYCNWTGTLTGSEDIDLDEPFTLTFSWSDVSWDTETKTFSKNVHVDVSNE